MTDMPDGFHSTVLGDAHDALNRMARAHRRGTGCHLTSEMIKGLYLTNIGDQWTEADPREEPPND